MSEDSTNLPLVIYDGDCPVCTATAERLRKRRWSRPHEVVAFQDLETDLAAKVSDAGIDRQMLIHDPSTGAIVGGFNAMREVEAASGHSVRAVLLGLPGVAQLGALAYRLFAANRRLLSPVPQEIQCACDPTPRLWEQALLWLVLLAPIVVLGWMFDWTARPGYLALCAAWLLPLLAAPWIRVGWLRLLGQLLVALSIAALAGVAIWLFVGLVGDWLPVIGVRRAILTLATMWWVGGIQLSGRLKTLGAPRLEWLWMGATLAVLLVASATWCPLR